MDLILSGHFSPMNRIFALVRHVLHTGKLHASCGFEVYLEADQRLREYMRSEGLA